MKDWLGNDLEVGSLVLYSSTSTLTGMNLGEIIYIGDDKVQIRLKQPINGILCTGRVVTLHRSTSAYRSMTRFSAKLINLEGVNG